jgi:hypothetical protein
MSVGVKAAAGEIERFGQFTDGIIFRERFHQCVWFGGISADKMPTAFFKMVALSLQLSDLLAQASQFALLGALCGQRLWLAQGLTEVDPARPASQRPHRDTRIACSFRNRATTAHQGNGALFKLAVVASTALVWYRHGCLFCNSPLHRIEETSRRVTIAGASEVLAG